MEPGMVCIGKTTKKLTYGGEGEREVTPFVAQDSMEQFGVGVEIAHPNGQRESWIWGLVTPRLLIQSWRAMKLLEEAPRIHATDGLAGFWYAVGKRVHTSDWPYISETSVLFENADQFREARARALASLPTDEELKEMLDIAEAQKLNISAQEIEQELRDLASAERILERLRVADRIRAEDEALRRVPQGTTVPPSPAVKRKTFFKRLFG